MTTLPNGLTVSTEVGKGSSPRISLTAFEKRRDSLKRAFSSSGDSPPLRIMPLNSLRSM
jgi:hypothetical protein